MTDLPSKEKWEASVLLKERIINELLISEEERIALEVLKDLKGCILKPQFRDKTHSELKEWILKRLKEMKE